MSQAYRTSLKAALIFLAAFALYFISRSRGLDDYDSVQFAMGVREFDIWKHQPHPPGYPLFIFLGWLGAKVFHLGPEMSLHAVSAVGGGLFIAMWFLIIRLQFTERLAWFVALSLAITPVVWMTTTKVLTDAPAAGFLSAEILAALYFRERGRPVALVTASLCGAAAMGTRPQLIAVVVLILFLSVKQSATRRKMLILAAATLIGGSLVWLMPMWYGQARLRPDVPGWLVYPKLLYSQWQWRFDKPHIYIGAGDWSAHYLGTRFLSHFLGWFGLGFGFIQSGVVLALGVAVVVLGFGWYMFGRHTAQDGAFWRFHAPWALIHIAIIFACLSSAPRYYLIIFPLLLVALLRGFLRLASPWKWSALALPVLLLYVTAPAAIENHREEAPPVRLVRYLEKLYPSGQRKNVALLFVSARRHAEWYAPEFKTFPEIPPPDKMAAALSGATAVYTDDAKLTLPPEWRRVPLAIFKRSSIIYLKYRFVPLFVIERRIGP